MTETVTMRDALARCRRVALSVAETSTPEAVARLLEKLSQREDACELRDALVLEGAAAILRDTRS